MRRRRETSSARLGGPERVCVSWRWLAIHPAIRLFLAPFRVRKAGFLQDDSSTAIDATPADQRTVRWVIPAYNEEASIADLIDRIAEVCDAERAGAGS